MNDDSGSSKRNDLIPHYWQYAVNISCFSCSSFQRTFNIILPDHTINRTLRIFLHLHINDKPDLNEIVALSWLDDSKNVPSKKNCLWSCSRKAGEFQLLSQMHQMRWSSFSHETPVYFLRWNTFTADNDQNHSTKIDLPFMVQRTAIIHILLLEKDLGLGVQNENTARLGNMYFANLQPTKMFSSLKYPTAAAGSNFDIDKQAHRPDRMVYATLFLSWIVTIREKIVIRRFALCFFDGSRDD